MPYHPSFAFFGTATPLSTLAPLLVGRLGGRLPAIGLEVDPRRRDIPRRLEFAGPEGALDFLRRHDVATRRLWMTGELARLTFWMPAEDTLGVDGWDGTATAAGPGRQDGGDDIAQAGERRRLMLALHQVLTEHCGALLVYTSGHEDSYAGEPGHSSLFAHCRRQLDQGADLSPFLFRELAPYFWLVSARQGMLRPAGDDFEQIHRGDGFDAFENFLDRPFFLQISQTP